tara:strand:+ start:101 stop:376 length:276 start_codon:yes stop_codon:yes gene_type:complete
MDPFCGNLFWFAVVWLMLFPFVDNMFDIRWPSDASKWEKPQKQTVVLSNQEEVQQEGFKREPSRWDWTEYRRHRNEEAFVETSMWLSMGDD